MRCDGKTVLITGASAGIGKATAALLAAQGARLILAARSADKLLALQESLEAKHQTEVLCITLDVQDAQAVSAAITALPAAWQSIDVLVNNAGLALGLSHLSEGNVADWDQMIDTNVKGLLYMTSAVLPGMLARNVGHIVNIGSISGYMAYPGGVVYCATKHAVRAISQGLKAELHGTPLRVSEIDPGMAETEFSVTRFGGDVKRAAEVYKNIRPMTGLDVAETILFCITRPPHVDVRQLRVVPTDQDSTGF